MAANAHHHWQGNRVEDLPHASVDALRTALAREGEPDTWFDDMAWIMAHESSGRVGVHNSTSSAVGLFQLTRVNYHLMPRGAASIGDAVDEAIGGIRYVRQRYHTAQHARQFWEAHHWY
jgi:SLT domain-containing protein